MDSLEALVAHIDQPGIDRDPARDILKLAPSLTQDEALAVQLAVKRRRVEAGDRIIGHQASFTSSAVQKAFPGAPVPMVGTLLASLIRASGDVVEIGPDPTVLECEIGCVLKRDLFGSDLNPTEILAAIEGFCPVVEVAPVRPGVREGHYSWPHMIAVQKAAGGFIVVGQRLTPPSSLDLRLEGCLVSIDGIPRAGAIGFEAMGSPLAVIAALAAKLHVIGEGLRAGQLVITGSLPSPQPVGMDDRTALAEFTNLGAVALRFTR